MRNIEIKVRVPDLDGVRESARRLNANHEWIRKQIDTYFRTRTGRLKLRETAGEQSGTLISYERPDKDASRISQYHLLTVDDVETLKEMLAGTLGVLVTVAKTRELWIYGRTRVHLDEVEGLGHFVELETVIADQDLEDARKEHRFVWSKLGLDSETPVSVSYSDLSLSDCPTMQRPRRGTGH